MKTRFRLIRRGTHPGTYYCVDNQTGSRASLGKATLQEAKEIVQHKNIAERQPLLNLAIAKAYLGGTDSRVTTRTWGDALTFLTEMKSGPNLKRWRSVAKDKAIKPLLPKILVQTKAEELLSCIKNGTVSTNTFLRRLHNYSLDMGWLPWPILHKRQWPIIRHKEKRAITLDEHLRIVEREQNPERKAYYKLAWHLGASQTDLANLHNDHIDWKTRVITIDRVKIQGRNLPPAQIRFGSEVEAILHTLPKEGGLFPYLASVREGDRATEFKQRCDGLGITGVTLHSYRYAWAERAKVAGYPERFAQVALGHNSKAVHRAYSRNANVTIPPLEDYEKKIVQFPLVDISEDQSLAK